ncbi:MAG: DUF1572 domain-containing protein [Bacteroidetes bacterium]|nr:MAG: DUF1572 domain-containing protein [Bacteroidota bacterium]
MSISAQTAQHLRQVFTGGNWTSVNLRDTLSDVSWQEATHQLPDTNSIATLVYHIVYYVRVITPVLKGKALTGHDKESFSTPPIASPQDWEAFVSPIWEEVENLAQLMEQIPDVDLLGLFAEEKYGSNFRNFHGLIEHTHYHLGQIVLLKKWIRSLTAT